MQTLIHKECNYYLYLHASRACEGADSFVKCFFPSAKRLDCVSDTAGLGKGSNCYYYVICVGFLKGYLAQIMRWCQIGSSGDCSVYIDRVGTVAECALPTLPYTLESCIAITPVSVEGSMLIFDGCRQDACCAPSCGSSVLEPRGFGLNLARSPSAVPS